MLFSGPGVTPTLKGSTTNAVALPSGCCFELQPAGWYFIRSSIYHAIQQYDPTTNVWRTIGGGIKGAGGGEYIFSDGQNYRLANLTGCVVGALLTAGGSGYTSSPAVSSGTGAIFKANVGGAVATSVVISNGGSNYVYPPAVLVSTPPPGGVPATMTCAITSGAVSGVTVTNQGSGYLSPPTIQFINDPREGNNGLGTGAGATASCTLTGTGQVTSVLCLDPGLGGQTSVPTLTFSGGGGSAAAATAIMCWTITAYTAGTAGAGLAGTVAQISAEDAFPTTAPAFTNPETQAGLVKVRNADIKAPISGAGITATGLIVNDGGIYTSVPTPLVIPTASIVTTAPVVTFTMGGATGTSYVTPM